MPILLGHAADEVYKEILRRMESGIWTVGSRLPPQLRLTKEFAVSRSTIQKVIQKLLSDGQIVTRRGGGTFIAGHKELLALRSNVVSLMCVLSEIDWNALQSLALNAHLLLCLYSQDQHKWLPKEEQIFLEQVRKERHKAILGVFSPLPPLHEELLVELAAQGTRVIHLAPQTIELPKQEYLMADYRKAGFMAGMAMALQRKDCFFSRFKGDGPYAQLTEMGYAEAMSNCGRVYDLSNHLLVGEELQIGLESNSMKRLRELLRGPQPALICARDIAMMHQIQACVDSIQIPSKRLPTYWTFTGDSNTRSTPELNLLFVDIKKLAQRALQHVLADDLVELRELVSPQLIRVTK